jgi:hypothetical protein
MYLYMLDIKHWLGFTPVPHDLEELAFAERAETEKELKERASQDIENGIRLTYSLEEFLEDFGKIRLTYDYLEVFLDRADALAKKHGWEGEGNWLMSALPQCSRPSLILVIKREDRDLSYVFSPHELTWLSRYKIDYLV